MPHEAHSGHYTQRQHIYKGRSSCVPSRSRSSWRWCWVKLCCFLFFTSSFFRSCFCRRLSCRRRGGFLFFNESHHGNDRFLAIRYKLCASRKLHLRGRDMVANFFKRRKRYFELVRQILGLSL